jgi:FdhD protein
MIPHMPSGGSTSHHAGIQVEDGSAHEINDELVCEGLFRLYLNDTIFSEVVASDDLLRELGAGFVICEGLADSVDSVNVNGDEIRVYADIRGTLNKELRSSGCIGVRREPRPVVSSLTITIADVYRITREIETDVWRKTGGVHCAVLFSEGEILVKSSDVGRHNTVDKIVGFAELHGINRSACVTGCTGRQPSGMVAKSAHAGIPVIISRAASTDRGIAKAESAGVTLVCFSRGERFTVYSRPDRIRDLPESCKVLKPLKNKILPPQRQNQLS